MVLSKTKEEQYFLSNYINILNNRMGFVESLQPQLYLKVAMAQKAHYLAYTLYLRRLEQEV